MSADHSMRYSFLSGQTVMEVPRRDVPQGHQCEGDRPRLASLLGVHAKQLHLVPTEDPAVVNVAVLDSYRVSCIYCGLKIECACDRPALQCSCVEAQGCLYPSFAVEDLCTSCFFSADRYYERPEEATGAFGGASSEGAAETRHQRRQAAPRKRTKQAFEEARSEDGPPYAYERVR